MALAGMAHPLAEMAIALGANGIPMALSTLSSTRLEDLAATEATPFWFQLYVYRDRGITQSLVERAEAAGYEALVVTVDVAVAGNRERDRRNRFQIPDGVTLKNLEEASRDRVAMPPTIRPLPPTYHLRLTRRSPGMTSTGCVLSPTCRSCSKVS